MASIDERVARIEGGYEHLATKADIAELRSEVRAMKWMLGLGLTAVVAGVCCFAGDCTSANFLMVLSTW